MTQTLKEEKMDKPQISQLRTFNIKQNNSALQFNNMLNIT